MACRKTGLGASGRAAVRALAKQFTRKRRRSRRWDHKSQLETLEPRQLLAGDLVGHWLADDLNATVASGDPITAWTDSVAGITAPATGDPRLIQAVHDGHSVVRFDPTDAVDAFRVAAADSPMSGADDFTIAVVFATPFAGVGGSSLWFQNTGLVDGTRFFGATPDWGLVLNGTGQVGAGLGGPAKAVYSSASRLNDGAIHVGIYTRSGGTMSVYVDTGPADVRTDGSPVPRDIGDMTFGSLQSGALPFRGDIAEIRIYDGALSESEVGSLAIDLLDFYINVPPIARDDAYAVDEDTPLVVGVADGLFRNDVDVEGDPISALLLQEASHGTVDLAPDGAFVYTPAPDFFGTDTFAYLVRDGYDNSDTATVTIDVVPQFDAASAVADRYVVDAGSTLTVGASAGVLANDMNPDQVALTAVLAEDVPHGSLVLAEDGAFTYDPQGFTGATTFQYTVRDAVGDQNRASVTLVVDSLPVAENDQYEVSEDTVLDVLAQAGVLANDRDAEGDTLTARLVTPPAHGTFTLQGDGSFTYRPDRDYAGPDRFTYRADDGDQQTLPVTAALNVTGTNDRPVATADRYFGRPNQALRVPAEEGLLANDHDLDGPEELEAILVVPPTHGTLQVEADGSFRYEPDPDFQGSDRFTYRATDGVDNSEPVTVSLYTSSQRVVISELMAKNTGALLDYYDVASDWIEILNEDATTVDLGGWYLTDDAGNLTKWQVPAGTRLAPGERLLVFASGRDRVAPNGELHTNFNLSGSGEYVALVQPNGTAIAWDAFPTFPAQFANVSYGATTLTETTELVGSRTSARVFVPSDGRLGTAWRDIGFDDSGWDDRTTGVGFALQRDAKVVPGFTTRMVDVKGGTDGELNTALEAEAVLDGDFEPGVYEIGTDVTTTSPKIDFGGRAGTFNTTQPYPDGTSNTRLTDFAIRATATVTIPAGEWTIGFGSDEGGLLRLDGIHFIDTFGEDGPATDGDGELLFNGTRGHRWSRGTFSVGEGGFTTKLTSLFFERRGDDSFELAITRGHTDGDVDPTGWTLIADGALGWHVATTDLKPVSVLSPLVASSIADAMADQRTSAYLRIPFDVADPADLASLTLRMRYDDGFVATINGVEVARANVSGTPAWNSTADGDRPDAEALVPEVFDLTTSLNVLRSGTNILAIDGLNASTNSDAFLVMPQLEVVRLRSRALGFMEEATPGEANRRGAVGVLARPTFSVAATTFEAPFMLELSTDQVGATIHFTTDGSIPTRQSPVYSGPIAITKTTQVRARVALGDYVTSPTASATYVRLDTNVLGFSSDLPLLVIETFDALIGRASRSSFTALFEPGTDGRSSLVGTPAVASRSEIRVRGSSSSGFAKKPYALELQNDDSNDDRAVSLLGMPANSDWVLTGPFTFDRSFTRNALIYDLSNQVGRYAPRTRFVEVFVHDSTDNLRRSDYVGVYVLTEKIKRGKDRVDVEKISSKATTELEIKGGYILKFDRAGPGETGFLVGDPDALQLNIKYVEPKEVEIKQRPAQAAWLTDYINRFLAALKQPNFTDPKFGHYSQYIDVQSFVDHQILNELAWNVDAFVLSAYLFKTRDGKLEAGPLWDFDRSQESTDPRDDSPERWLTNRFFGWYQRLFEDPDFQQAYIDRWQQWRDGPLSNRNVFATLDGLASQVEEAQVRNFERWPGVRPRSAGPFNSIGLDGTWRGEVEHQRAWLAARLAWLDGKFLAKPRIQEEGGVDPSPRTVTLTGPASATLYYTIDGTDPRAPGGQISATALRYDGPIAVTETTTLRARAYDPGFDSDFVAVEERWSGVETRAINVKTTHRPPLRISEIHYNPADPSAAEVAAGYNDNDAFEFIELVNAGPRTIDLADARLVETTVNGGREGVAFNFSDGAIGQLQPGGRVLVVENSDAFRFRYGDRLPIAGAWQGRLSNRGELLTLVVGDTVTQQFRYSDQWFPSTDGGGPSLEIIDALADVASWSERSSWRASSRDGGTPGEGPSRADFNRDGRPSVEDIDLLYAQIQAGTQQARFDLTLDGRVDQRDVTELVEKVLGTTFGDTDLDGDVDSADIGQAIGEFTGPTGQGRSWSSGDVDGDGDVDNLDLGKIIGNFNGPVGANGRPVIKSTELAATSPAARTTAADGSPSPPLLITEFMASNATTLVDRHGLAPDWIELHNTTDQSVRLAGWSLTDDRQDLNKWSLPDIYLAPQAYYVVYASGRDRTPENVFLTRDFNATKDGTFLVDLPEGAYDVRVTLGDSDRVRDAMAIDLQGTRVDTVTAQANAFAVRTYRAEVTAADMGRLAIRLEDTGGQTGNAAINALRIVPVAGGDPLRFDFGTADSPVAPGYVRVQKTDVYGQASYGWQAGDVIKSGDRGGEPDGPQTNFKLSATGEYLALVSPAGKVVSQFGTAEHDYPPQVSDVSYGLVPGDGPLDASPAGYLALPTPGAPNRATSAIIGPNIQDVTQANGPVDDAEDLVITARVEPFLAPVDTVSLVYRVMFGQETRIPMADDGTGSDLLAGDGIYTAVIPHTVSGPGEMVRWAVTAVDTAGHGSRAPLHAGVQFSAGQFSFASNFPQGTADGFLPISGQWTVSGGRYVVTPDPTGDSVAVIPALTAIGDRFSVDMTFQIPSDSTDRKNAAFIFDYHGPNDFKFVLFNHDASRWQFGQRDASGWNVLQERGNTTPVDKDVQSTIRVDRSVVALLTRGLVRAKYDFGVPVNGGLLGIGSNDGQVRFASFAFDPGGLDDVAAPKYFGTIVADPSIVTELPVLHRFIENPQAAETAVGTRGSVFYAGEFYDNVFIRIRGGTSRAWPKKSYKIDFNSGNGFRFREDAPRVSEININATYTDKAYTRAILASELQQDSGTPSPETFPLRMQQNGEFFSVALFVEQPDDHFLARNGLDPEGAFYKAGPGSRLDAGTRSYAKKTRKDEDNSDLQAFIGGLAQTGSDLEAFLFDHVDLPAQINFMATNVVTQNIDASNKNYFMYRDTRGSGEWHMTPWDIDLTFGPDALNTDTIVSDENTEGALYPNAVHPLLGGREVTLQPGKFNALLDRIMENPRTREMLLRRIRSLTDQFLSTSYLYDRIDQLVAQLGPDVDLDKQRWGTNGNFGSTDFTLVEANDRIKQEYLDRRARYLTVVQGPGGVGIPAAQSADTPLDFGADFQLAPSSGDPRQAYITLVNPNPYAIDLSGWTLAGPAHTTFAAGTVIPAGDTLYLTPDVSAFRSRTEGPSGGERRFVQSYSGVLSPSGGTLTLFDASGRQVARQAFGGSGPADQHDLRVSEIMYNPAPDAADPSIDNDDFEFIELVNTSDTTSLDLENVRFTQGIEFTFPQISLGAGERVVVVRNLDAFQQRYGTEIRVAGEYGNFKLSNAGETLRLEDATGALIQELTYNDTWYRSTDGGGFSLEVLDVTNADPAHFSQADAYLPSIASGGTPGADRASAPVAPGDANLDGQVDARDVADFTFGLTDPGAYQDRFGVPAQLAGDTDGDGDLDYDDIGHLVSLLAEDQTARRR